MSQNNNLSIDEILREAQEVLSSIGGDSVSGESAEAQQDDVKTYVPQKKSRPETNEQTKDCFDLAKVCEMRVFGYLKNQLQKKIHTNQQRL